MSVLPKKILLATDGSEGMILATRAAVDVSNKVGSELHVVHAWAPIHHNTYPVNCCSRTPDYSCLYGKDAQELLTEQIKYVENSKGPGSIKEAHLRRGRPVNEVLALSEELGAGLIVLGSSNRNWVERILGGSFSKSVVHRASCPILVVPGVEGAWPPARIIIGEEFSEYDEGVGELAARLGKLFGARVLLVQAGRGSPEASRAMSGIDARRVSGSPHMIEGDSDKRVGKLEENLGGQPAASVAAEDLSTVVLDVAQVEATLVAVSAETFTTTRSMRLMRRTKPENKPLSLANILGAASRSALIAPCVPRN